MSVRVIIVATVDGDSLADAQGTVALAARNAASVGISEISVVGELPVTAVSVAPPVAEQALALASQLTAMLRGA